MEVLPHSFDTQIFEGARTLSVVQRQLTCIARAALVEPRILILDEATANVDSLTEALIEQALNRLLVGRTAMVIAHRLSTIRMAYQILVVSGNEIVESGCHENLLAKHGLYAKRHEQQFILPA